MNRRWSDALRWLAVCLALAGTVPAWAAWDIDALMRGLAQNTRGHARFVEKKYFAMVDLPVESSGELRYVAPDRFEKMTEKPRPETMVLAQGVLTLDRSGRPQQQLRLSEHPEVAAFVESIRGTLVGDRATLERLYKLQLDGTEARWILTLVPRQARMLGVVKIVRMEGSRADLRSVEIEQSDTDRSVMTIEKIAAP